MSETWMHVLKNAQKKRGEGNYPVSPRVLDVKATEEYIQRILESGDSDALTQLLSLSDQSIPAVKVIQSHTTEIAVVGLQKSGFIFGSGTQESWKPEDRNII